MRRNPDAPAAGRKPRRARRRDSTIEIIEQLLLCPRSISLNGEPTQLPTINVIILQLMQKEMAGSLRAGNALLKYEEFATRRTERKLEIYFAGNDYTDGDEDA
jgi:hypothetical protein